MKAVMIDRFGGAEQLQLRDTPTPRPNEDEVLVEVEVAGVGFGDLIIRSGAAGLADGRDLVLGTEAAGRIVGVGSRVDAGLLGKRVFAAPFAIGKVTGAYATHLAIPANGVFVLPDAISFEQAVALGVAGVVALELAELVPIRDRTVLVHSAAGGVGHLLVQLLARHQPAYLIGSVGDPGKAATLSRIELDGVVSTRSDWLAQLLLLTVGNTPDVIFDAIGGTIGQQGLAALAPGGHFISYGGSSGHYTGIAEAAMPAFVMARQSLLGYSMMPLLNRPDGTEAVRKRLEVLYHLVAESALEVHIGHRFALADAADAHRLLQSRASHGKIILYAKEQPQEGDNIP